MSYTVYESIDIRKQIEDIEGKAEELQDAIYELEDMSSSVNYINEDDSCLIDESLDFISKKIIDSVKYYLMALYNFDFENQIDWNIRIKFLNKLDEVIEQDINFWKKKESLVEELKTDDEEFSEYDCKLIASSLHINNDVKNFNNLLEIVEKSMYEFQAEINNVADGNMPKLSMAGVPIEIIAEQTQKLRQFKGKVYYLLIDEYENFMILSESENEEIKQTIDKYKIYLNPEPFVINMLYNQIPDLMNRKKLNACVEVCDRIIKIASDHSKEVVYAMKCKAECKRIIIAREQFGV